MHWLFQLYTSNVYYVSSLIHFQLRLKGPCMFRAGGPGAQMSWTRTPSTEWMCVCPGTALGLLGTADLLAPRELFGFLQLRSGL